MKAREKKKGLLAKAWVQNRISLEAYEVGTKKVDDGWAGRGFDAIQWHTK